MALHKIENYIKLLCVRVDNFDSYIIDELNTSDDEEIKDFITTYKHKKGFKILVFKISSMNVITFEQVQNLIHSLHAFDYIRKLIESDDTEIIKIHT